MSGCMLVRRSRVVGLASLAWIRWEKKAGSEGRCSITRAQRIASAGTWGRARLVGGWMS